MRHNRYATGLLIGITAMIPGFQGDLRSEEPIIPGSTDLSEEAILRRMETEIGLKPTSRPAPGQKSQSMSPPESEPCRYRVEALTKSGSRISGTTILSQENILLRTSSDGDVIPVPIRKIRRIEIQTWKIARVTERSPGTYRVYHVPDRVVITDAGGRSFSGTLAATHWLQISLDNGGLLSQSRLYFTEDIRASDPATAKRVGEKHSEAPADLITALIFPSEPIASDSSVLQNVQGGQE